MVLQFFSKSIQRETQSCSNNFLLIRFLSCNARRVNPLEKRNTNAQI